MKKLTLVLAIILSSCNSPIDIEKEKLRILQTDRDFAVLSVQSGAAEAFKLYAREDAFLLPPNEEPVQGRDKIVQGFVEFDKKFILDWQPQAAEVAASGDLAYSWGTSTGSDRATGQPAFRGKYLTVWKKDADGNWKFIADLGNSSPAVPAQGMQ
jgi:ketosteroid isomerase-like protein